MKIVLTLASFALVAISSFISGIAIGRTQNKQSFIPSVLSTITKPIQKEKPFTVYTVQNLSKTEFKPGRINIKKTLEIDKSFTSYLFNLIFNPDPGSNKSKTTTGMLNIPEKDGKFPIIIMIRGFVDQEIYETGMGSQRAAEAFVKKGYITIAPDFLGYAGSDEEAGNVFETRFQTYTTILSLLETIGSKDFQNVVKGTWDGENIFIWAHSNGGQVALTTLAITRESFPTTLWAPVTKSFPYSILYYTNEAEDGGKYLRSELANFEEDYNVDLFSFTNYIKKINAPIQIQQGTNDDAIPEEWSQSFVAQFEEDEEPDLIVLPGADHNMVPSWNQAISNDLDFFLDNTKQ